MSAVEESRAVDHTRLLIEMQCRDRHYAEATRRICLWESDVERARQLLASPKLKQLTAARNNATFDFALEVRFLAEAVLRVQSEVERLQRAAAEAST